MKFITYDLLLLTVNSMINSHICTINGFVEPKSTKVFGAYETDMAAAIQKWNVKILYGN